jgi:hypothetical protein
MLYGTPNAGSMVDGKKRAQLVKALARCVNMEVPPKLERALELHSDALLDLSRQFRELDICMSRKLSIYSFHETRTTPLVGDKVCTLTFYPPASFYPECLVPWLITGL